MSTRNLQVPPPLRWDCKCSPHVASYAVAGTGMQVPWLVWQVLSWLSHLPHSRASLSSWKAQQQHTAGLIFLLCKWGLFKIIPTHLSLFPSLNARTRSWLPLMYFCPSPNHNSSWMIRSKLRCWLGRRGRIFWRCCSPSSRDIQMLVHSHRKTRLGEEGEDTTPRKEAGRRDRLEGHLPHLADRLFSSYQWQPLHPLRILPKSGWTTQASQNWNPALIRTGRTFPLQQGRKPGRSAYRAAPVREKAYSKYQDKNRSSFGSAQTRTSWVMLSMDKQKGTSVEFNLTWSSGRWDLSPCLNCWSSHKDFLCLKHTPKELLPKK